MLPSSTTSVVLTPNPNDHSQVLSPTNFELRRGSRSPPSPPPPPNSPSPAEDLSHPFSLLVVSCHHWSCSWFGFVWDGFSWLSFSVRASSRSGTRLAHPKQANTCTCAGRTCFACNTATTAWRKGGKDGKDRDDRDMAWEAARDAESNKQS